MATDEGLRLNLLGKPEITLNGAPVTGFVYNKGLALLAYLAVTKRPHTRAALAGLLWGEMPDATAKANLRKILSVLREVTGPDLVIDRQTVTLARGSLGRLDTESFETKLHGMTARSQSPKSLSEGEVWELQEAVKLYQGEFLEGFYVHNAPAFEEWVLSEREHLRQMAVHALFSLVAHYTAGGDYGRGLSYATRLLALEPWHEEVHQQLMFLLALSGQRSAALNQYEICRQLLAEELGAEPNPDTIELHRKIARGEVTLQAVPLVLTLDWPVEVTPFVGRAEELAKLVAFLTRPESHLATVVGISGVGKTRMVLQVAAATMEFFGQEVYYVQAAAASSREALSQAMVRAAGIPLAGQRHASEQVIAWLRARKVLIVLDQLSDYPGVADFCRDLIHEASQVRLLVTCSHRLNLPGEWVLPLYGLDVPQTDDLEGLRASDAVRLYSQAVERACGVCKVEDEQLPYIARTCRLVEGLPLGIELAAAWARLLTHEDIAKEIESSYRFLSAVAPDSPHRHHSLFVAFDYSWNRMSENERRLLKRLSVFRGGFTRPAAEQVAGASLPVLAGLMDKCLIERTAGGSYRIHGLLAEFGREKLAEHPEEEAQTYERYCSYYEGFLRSTMAAIDAAPDGHGLLSIAAEHANLDATWKWALAHVGQEDRQSGTECIASRAFVSAARAYRAYPAALAGSGV